MYTVLFAVQTTQNRHNVDDAYYNDITAIAQDKLHAYTQMHMRQHHVHHIVERTVKQQSQD